MKAFFFLTLLVALSRAEEAKKTKVTIQKYFGTITWQTGTCLKAYLH
jgi:hypothetical protein